jgi:dUTP pyrophosphatase
MDTNRCKIYLDENAEMPRMAENSAAYDLFSPVEVTIGPGECIKLNTGVRIQLHSTLCGRILPKSSLSVPGKELFINGGLIDPGYHGYVHVIMKNMSSAPHKIEARQKIAQLLITHYIRLDFEEVDTPDKFTVTHRGSRGFGSTGQF